MMAVEEQVPVRLDLMQHRIEYDKHDLELDVLVRHRATVFLLARNPSTHSVLVQLLRALPSDRSGITHTSRQPYAVLRILPVQALDGPPAFNTDGPGRR